MYVSMEDREKKQKKHIFSVDQLSRHHLQLSFVLLDPIFEIAINIKSYLWLDFEWTNNFVYCVPFL